MNNALGFPFGFFVNDNTPDIAKYFKGFNTTGTKVPYVSVAEVNTLLASGLRHIGLTVNINGVEYWYNNGILDSDLVVKGGATNTASGNTTIKEFYITGDGTTTSFAFTHNLNNKKVKINVSEDYDDYEEIDPRRFTSTVNTATVVFQVAPTTGQNYNVIVIGIDKSTPVVPGSSGFSSGFSNGFN